MPLNDAEREHLARRLEEERVRVIRLLERSVTDQSTESGQDRAGDLTKIPFHLADLGTDAIEAERAASNATRLSAELADIDTARDRLSREPERYGFCEYTGREIPFERLDTIPWARTCDEPGA